MVSAFMILGNVFFLYDTMIMVKLTEIMLTVTPEVLVRIHHRHVAWQCCR